MPLSSQSTLPRQGLPGLPPAQRRLRIVHSPDAARVGAWFDVGQEPVTLGRTGRTGFVDGGISREHCRISTLGGALRIEDLNSTNGTFLKGERIERDYLIPNATVRIGDTLFVLDEEPAPDLYAAAPGTQDTGLPEFVGSSFTSAAIRRWLNTAGPSEDPVLILGQSGVGKEVVARALHRLSGRKGPLVAVNCGAIQREIADAELFGHKRGAFTGAAESRDGLIAKAHRGTLFLDEVGDLAHELQVKLLRVLEERSVRPVGDTSWREVDVRVVAATNVDLEEKQFRKDLRARLSTWTLNLPGLATRRADILPLARYFAQERGTPPTGAWGADFAEALLLYDWPLNVRELQRTIQRAASLAGAAVPWELTTLPAGLQKPLRDREGQGAGSGPTRDELEAALRQTHGNVVQIAQMLGRDRTQVYRWLKKYGLEADDFR